MFEFWKHARIAARAAVAAAAALAAPGAGAVTGVLHDFIVTRDGAQYFRDAFADGLAPPSAPPYIASGNPVSYYVGGSYPAGSEADGRLTLDSNQGGIGTSANGVPSRTQRATLLTNADQNSTNGLKPSRTFTLSALLDMTTVSGPGSIGVRFVDRTVNATGTSSLRESLAVEYVPSSGTVRMRHQDFFRGEVQTLGSLSTPLGADEVRLILSHPVVDVPLAIGSAEFFDHGQSLGIFDIGGAASIFNYRQFVRPELAAGMSLPVPEPHTVSMMLIGLGLIAWRRWRRAGQRTRPWLTTPSDPAAWASMTWVRFSGYPPTRRRC